MKWYVKLCLVFILCTIGIFVLIRQGKSLNVVPNGFNRTAHPAMATFVSSYTVHYPINNISLLSDSEIWITENNMQELGELNLRTLRLRYTQTGLPDSIVDRIGTHYFTNMLGPVLFIFAYNQNRLIKVDTRTKKIDTIRKPGSLMIRGVPFTSTKIGIREYNNAQRDCEFSVWDISTNSLHIVQQPMKYFHDGGINTDGQLYFSKHSNMLLFVPYYYNTVYEFDTAFISKGTFRTIDTTTTPKIKVKESRNFRTTGGPAFVINRSAFFDRGELGIYSNLKGDNESNEVFNSNTVIDIYDCNKGVYKYSVYLPKHGREKIINILRCENIYVCQSAHELSVYKIN